jgi:RHH-type transcriptional regulator, proline utilization regulon repressor / proline dehydrogenase / delta 1-pyrroline-5-carboxylate dehydrogenase
MNAPIPSSLLTSNPPLLMPATEEAALAALRAIESTAGLEAARHAVTQSTGNTLAQAMQQGARDTLALRLLAAFPLTSAEGLALMRMTEALLRVPDERSAAQLLCDELASAKWQAQSSDTVARMAASGLRLARACLSNAKGEPRALLIKPAVAIARRGVQHFGGQFVFAQTISEALQKTTMNGAYSFDMLGEQALNAADVQRFERAYREAIEALGPLRKAGRDVSVSIKLSALHARYTPLQRARVMDELVPRVDALIQRARAFELPVCIDAEEAERLELSLEVFTALSEKVRGWDGLGLAVQAYQLRAPQVIARVAELAVRDARRIPMRLVKGAYWDSEIKHAQSEGLHVYPVFTHKAHTDTSYLACAALMLKAHAHIKPAFATHNAYSFAAITQLAEQYGIGNDYEFQCLHGMGEPLVKAANELKLLKVPVRLYAPVGAFDALLPYLVRRLLENGANTSFLAGLNSEESELDEAEQTSDNALLSIPLPCDLFAGRVNSQGVDWGSQAEVQSLLSSQVNSAYSPILSSGYSALRANNARNNYITDDSINIIAESTEAQVQAMLTRASAAAPAWASIDAKARGALISAWGDALQTQLPALAALIVEEAGKTWPNAVADIREAVDFCRYYSQLCVSNDAQALGVVATISPWNFPLAIFTGQAAAALAAGNTVVAKPAEQTPRIAVEAVKLAHAIGIPIDALQLAIGDGKVGAQLVADARVNGVMFTGSLQVAKLIERTLHARSGEHEIPFIAETSGLNAMIVDSTALIDQAVNDVVASAFDSAGQRCSALRLLWLQDDIAERFIEALKGAMAQLRVGDSSQLNNDIGPVIDAEALTKLQQHEQRLQRDAKLIARVPMKPGLQGHFFAPCAYEIKDLATVQEETFGPVLHIRRFAARNIAQVLRDTEELGYALTFGLHTRLASRIELLSRKAPAGNLYINRNIIGAVVGSQPFGGSRKSGTGPKAGGPWALLRLQKPMHSPAQLRMKSQATRLPGVTGEHNSWQLVSRGVVACAGPSEQDVHDQTRLVQSLGLSAVDVRVLPAGLERKDLGAVLIADWNEQYSAEVAKTREDILPLIAKYHGEYSTWRLFEERVISNNIAAAGGDVSLLTRSD